MEMNDHQPISDDDDQIDDGHRDYGARTAFYNQASEKSLSHAEAKMLYRRHILDATDSDQQGPLKRARTFSSIENGTLGYGASQSPREQVKKTRKGEVSATDSESGLKLPSRHRKGQDAASDEDSDIDQSEMSRDVHAEPDVEAYGVQPSTHRSDISPELQAISSNILRVLDLRHRFLKLSLQTPEDNPKDSIGWRIYPPPPNPTWNENKSRSNGGTHSAVDEQADIPAARSKSRKPGHDIGDDFDIHELEPFPKSDDSVTFQLNEMSIYQLYSKSNVKSSMISPLVAVPSLREYYKAMDDIQSVSSDGPTKSFAYRQLDILEGKFQLYFLINSYQETADCKTVPHRDFYNVRKVDTHVHHSACMNQKHLLRFIKSKMKKFPDEVVMFRGGRELTLQQVFESINLTAYDLSIDTLDMHAHTDSFHRFDKFNLKYNPIGESRLREIFLKTDNYIKGRYLAELTKEVIADLEASKYQFVEWRISIYGRSIDEWDKLAAWVVDNKLISHNVRWLIQVPRLYSMYKATKHVEDFQDIILNVFEPLYKVTKEPTSNPKLHIFLQRVIGFDSVDDESKIEVRLYRKFPPPKEWTTTQNPPYTYWIYHLYANMVSLNVWRKRRGFNTFVLRPHCGEAGDVDHLASAVLCCHSISHGLMLRKVPLLQYIFYLDQIGIAMSPLSNNALFLSYDRNPFPKYLRRGLNVSLSTDDPLQFAFTKEPLIEEYSVAAQIYRLSAIDMCELAQHSVIQSGFEHELKKRWLGEDYHLPGVRGNNVAKSNVPDIREKFRYDTLSAELHTLTQYAAPNVSEIITATSSSQPSASGNPQKPMLAGKSGQKVSQPQSSGLDLDPFKDLRDKTGLTRTTSLVMPPVSRRTFQRNAHSPTLPQTRIFPGIVQDRHRRNSIRQGSGSETDVESMASSWVSSDNRVPKIHDPVDMSLRNSVLEEASEGN